MQLKHIFAAFTVAITIPLSACNEESYIGTVCTTAGTYCPHFTVEADGRLLNVGNNAALFAVIGFTYGGDGRMTFALPDLRNSVMVGSSAGIAQGQKLGGEKVNTAKVEDKNESTKIPQQVAVKNCVVVSGPFPARDW